MTCSRQTEVLALIPGRGGLKNPPYKNIQPFRAKQLIVHSIEQAIQARNIRRVIVSTDSDTIAALPVTIVPKSKNDKELGFQEWVAGPLHFDYNWSSFQQISGSDTPVRGWKS